MRALFVRKPGQVPDLEVREVETPTPRMGEVLVEVDSAGLCGHDIAIMTGLLRRGVDHDVILGHEISGRIVQVGEGVSGVSEGDAVVASLTAFCGECDRCRSGLDYRCRVGRGIGHGMNGGFAEYVALPARSVTPIPDGVDLTGAALLACPIGVCVRALAVAGVSAGESVLVTGAGGGLGIHAIQVAGSLGAQVFAATSSAGKLDVLDRFAPGGVILGGELDFSELALAFTEDEGVDVVVDTVGSAVVSSSIRSLAQYGRMVMLGEVAGGRAAIRLTDIMFRDAVLHGSTGANRDDIASAARLVAQGEVEPVVHATAPLEDAAEWVRMVTERSVTGRVVLRP